LDRHRLVIENAEFTERFMEAFGGSGIEDDLHRTLTVFFSRMEQLRAHPILGHTPRGPVYLFKTLAMPAINPISVYFMVESHEATDDRVVLLDLRYALI
jgi:hypothetical protein